MHHAEVFLLLSLDVKNNLKKRGLGVLLLVNFEYCWHVIWSFQTILTTCKEVYVFYKTVLPEG